MKKTINFNAFVHEFYSMGIDNHFSFEGLKALYNALIDFEKATGQEQELDVIMLCWTFSEYDSLEQYNLENNTDYKSIEVLKQDTWVIPINELIIDNGRFIAQDIKRGNKKCSGKKL